MKKKIGLLIAFISLLGCSSDNNSENYQTIDQPIHSWSNYHWSHTSNPLQLKLYNNVSAAWAPYLNESSYDWSLSSVLDTTVVPGVTNPKQCRPTLGQIQICSSSYGRTGWLGIAQIWTSGSHITQATVKVNDTYFKSSPYNSVAYKRLVMCQEIGHTFGLGHQDEVQTNLNLGSCMDYTNNPSGPPSNEHPNAHDYQELETIYSHLDTAAIEPSSVQNLGDKQVLITYVYPE